MNNTPAAIFTVASHDAKTARGALYDAGIDCDYVDRERTSLLTVDAADADLARTVLAPYLLPTLFTICWRTLRAKSHHAWRAIRMKGLP